MKKLFFSGIVALAIGSMYTSCSKDNDLYDENAIEQQEELKIQQQYVELKKTYGDAFVKEFGAIAPGHDWGFKDFTTTRAAITNGSQISGFYELPSDAVFSTKSNKGFQNFNKYGEGIYCVFLQAYKNVSANLAVNANMDKNTLNSNYTNGKPYQKFDNNATVSVSDHYLTLDELKQELGGLNSYYLQHIYKNTQSGPDHKDFRQLYAFNYNSNGWEAVTGFTQGKAAGVTFVNNQNLALPGYVLMAGMGTPNGSQPFLGCEMDGLVEKVSQYKILKIEGDYYIGINDEIVKKNNSQEPGEGANYCGWIIRIAKATPTTTPIPDKTQARIFCEDMGEIGDFDFNDLVFDAVLLPNNDIEITVLAAGGIYDYTIDGQSVTLGQMTNTGVNEDDVQIITIKADGGQPKYRNFNAIPVFVYPKGEQAAVYHYELDAPKGEAPQKFCTYVNIQWADEYVNIKRAYPDFNSWVNTYTPTEWSTPWEARFTNLDLGDND